jgi:RNA polymerase sigma factor (sigma-70 family)
MNKISYSSLLDNQLVDKLINGDVKAYEEFFVRYYSHLRNFVNCIVKNYNLAEDISQNVFMKLWLFRSSINPTFSVKNWLFVMAKNEAINYFKKLKPVLLADLPIVETKIAEGKYFRSE